ncbi:uncharacterized protein LOC124203051 isoform X2 [Daphnia pulex]|uniref:uncharacterized protein LOC124203051 isoform X2 n=1 Tax=Daphnia pulex TaxID=6669 RepID=UPI001EDD16D6|nr:uncharacterized protein LOC124203051 isoform X2 [Daphnia pulex]
MSSKGSASLVRNDHLTGQQQQEASVTMQQQQPNKGKVRPSSRQQLDVTTLIKRNKERRCHHYVTWPLLLAVAAACVALVTCHLWFTWHLQRKVEALQSRVQSLASTRDLDELRAQLRNLHDNLLYDDNDAGAQFNKDSMLEQHVFNGENNQETDQPGEIVDLSLAADGDKSSALLLSGLDDQEEEEEEKKDIRVFSSIHTPAERNEMLEVDWQRRTANSSSSKRVSKMDGQSKNRNKRQADLSSHTQDGVPIFDRGYGATPPNRTEGLRIYQSLLTNNGRNEPGQSRSAESDAAVVQQQQPHHRQNNFWRNRNKEKPRHRHQKSTTRSPALVDDVELSSVAAEFEANGQDLRSPSDTTSPPAAAKSSVAPSNVEFRHSRVKTSSENTGPLSVDQKIWSRSNGIFSIGAGPYASGGSLQEDRISAATAPAILTKTVTASVGSSSSQVRQQQQPNVYKVNQPAVNARSGSSSQQSSDNEDQISRDSPSSSSGKKRINKKQLRDLSHTATAVHLVADTRNSTSTSYENQEIASRNELGLHTSWKIAPSNWDSPLKTTPLVKIDGAILTVKQSGLYFIYAQVHYLDEHSTNAYEVFINTEPFLRCITSAFSETSFPKANTCYTAAATQLREGDKLFLRDIEPLRYSVLQPSKTFFGLIRMAPIADFS